MDFFIPLYLKSFLWKHLQYTDGILDTLQQSPDITAMLFLKSAQEGY